MLRQFGWRRRNTEPSVKRSRSSSRLRKRCDRQVETSGSRRRAVRPDVAFLSAVEVGTCCPLDAKLTGREFSDALVALEPDVLLVAEPGTRHPWPRRVPPAFHALAFDWTRPKAIAPYALGPAGRRAKVEQCAHPFF